MEGVIGEGLNEGDRRVRQKRVVRGWCSSTKYDRVSRRRGLGLGPEGMGF